MKIENGINFIKLVPKSAYEIEQLRKLKRKAKVSQIKFENSWEETGDLTDLVFDV